MAEKIDLSVIMPAFNEAPVIRESISSASEVLKGAVDTWEIIVVNDGSTDNTARAVTEAEEECRNVRLVSYTANRGRGYALRKGIKASRGKYVITIESDMSWGAGIIYELFEQLRNSSADIIIASPYMKGGGMLNVPFSRVLPSRIGNIILSLALSGRISTLSGMTRGYRGDVLRSLCLREDGKEIHLEIIAKALAENFVIKEIPATVRWPEGRSGKAGVGGLSLKTVKLIFTHLFFGFSQRPLLLFGPPAFLCLLAGLLAGGWLAFKYFIMNAVIGGQIVLVLISVFLIITGLQFFIICFLAYQAKDTQIRLFQLQNALNRFEKAITAGDND